jgi:hypothetical protein
MGNIQRPTETVDCKNFAGGDWQEQSGKNIDVFSHSMVTKLEA